MQTIKFKCRTCDFKTWKKWKKWYTDPDLTCPKCQDYAGLYEI